MAFASRLIRLGQLPASCRSRTLLSSSAREDHNQWFRANSILRRGYSNASFRLADLQRRRTSPHHAFASKKIHTTSKSFQQRQQNPDEPKPDDELPELDFDPQSPLDWRKWSPRLKGWIVLLMGGSMYYVAQ